MASGCPSINKISDSDSDLIMYNYVSCIMMQDILRLRLRMYRLLLTASLHLTCSFSHIIWINQFLTSKCSSKTVSYTNG